mmetsp:Transcript_17565/g.34543  ORF Transcript_17565/g.34543 Transcript_17565/m.34543 type:complete len:99 (+) Transcript_17565:110-406(+)
MSTDRFNVNVSLGKNWEHLQNRFVGTGHPDMTKFEWGVNMQRDSLASFLGHADMLTYFATAENESVERTRLNLLEKMIQPCGPPPKAAVDDDNDEILA